MTEVKPAELIFLCFMLLHGFVATLNCTSPTPESLFAALETNVFTKKLLRPVKNFSTPINITVGITVVGILGVDEQSQVLTTMLWQVLEWEIEGLSWDEEECGSKRVSVPRELLWVPDIHIAEFMDEDKSPKPPYVYLDNTGHVYDDKPVRVVSSCRLVIYTFPFDVQDCLLTYGSYLHVAADIRLIQGPTAEEILAESREVLETNGEWKLEDIRVAPSTLTLDERSFSQIKYHIILRRRSILYVVNLLIPSCFLITVDLFSFMLPTDSVDRSSFKMTLILGYSVFLLIMNDLLPITGETPLINVFFSISLALMVTSLLETMFIVNIQNSTSNTIMVPHWLSVLVLQYLAVIVLLPRKRVVTRATYFSNTAARAQNFSINSISAFHLQHASGDDSLAKPPMTPPEPALDELRKLSRDLSAIRLHIEKHDQGCKTMDEWRMIGKVLNRLLFGMYIVFITVSFITIICIWNLSKTPQEG
ncbi:5-hydroxytryptamine receptor 3A-like [Pseudoliparis swirei]|uniref:5-hydroxytryptamine receptor 3A-like n=1 Tax=Pseudoliparis swirei TaxID=2059687 RepID=UPI0024BE826A|nr:5-hydroxytryptamine receptor 3A-like [Pseudoliparis swirei]